MVLFVDDFFLKKVKVVVGVICKYLDNEVESIVDVLFLILNILVFEFFEEEK